MHKVSLPESGLYPLPNGSRSAHSGSPVPERTPVFKRDAPLHLDYFIQVREGIVTPSHTLFAIGWTDNQYAGQGRRRAQPPDYLAESGAVFLGRPLRAERFVGAICEH